MNARITEMRKHSNISRKQSAILLAENSKTNAQTTEMRKQFAILLTQNSKMNARTAEMRRHLNVFRK